MEAAENSAHNAPKGAAMVEPVFISGNWRSASETAR
jgi:hypothetical protein